MAIQTLKEIRDNVADTTREKQIDSTIDDFINLTLQEINDPAWAYEQIGIRGLNHLWSFNQRKWTFSTVADTEYYQLPRDLDKISLIRQTDSPVKLRYIPDEIFYRYVPNPTATGNPSFYRRWEEEGVETRLAADDTIDIVSSSTADTTQTVSVVGRSSDGFIQSETFTLNGTTTVTGSTTFDADYPVRVSKSAATTGKITVTENSGGTTLVILGPEERSPRFKVVGLYPIPSSAITIYMEYYTRIRRLVNVADVPDIDSKWIWVVRQGACAKVYQYQGKETMFTSAQAMYAAGVRSMIKADTQEPDYMPHLRSQRYQRYGVIEFTGEGYGSYGLNF